MGTNDVNDTCSGAREVAVILGDVHVVADKKFAANSAIIACVRFVVCGPRAADASVANNTSWDVFRCRHSNRTRYSGVNRIHGYF